MEPEQRGEYAETVSDSAQSLLTIINDILDFSKVEDRYHLFKPFTQADGATT